MMKIILFFFILTLVTCGSNEKLEIYNQTNKPVYYTFSPSTELQEFDEVRLYVDPKSPLGSDISYQNRIAAKSKEHVPLQTSWRNMIENTYGGRVNFFFFSVDTLEKFTWKEIMQYKLYSKMQSYTVDDLDKTNWQIIYPSKSHEFSKNAFP